MLKLVVLAALIVVAMRLALGRYPWDYLRAGERGGSLARSRALLGVGAEASREEILAAYRRFAAAHHPDRGGSDEALQRAALARDLLLRAVKKSSPD